jgi:hypothetical protein
VLVLARLAYLFLNTYPISKDKRTRTLEHVGAGKAGVSIFEYVPACRVDDGRPDLVWGKAGAGQRADFVVCTDIRQNRKHLHHTGRSSRICKGETPERHGDLGVSV